MLKRAATLLVFAASPVFAQSSSPVTASRMLWEDVTNYIVQSAMDMPEDKYSYKPTPAVRSFGELIGHVAGAQDMFCALALGEKPPAEDEVEKAATTKDALVKALKASNDHCRRAYMQSDGDATGMVELFGRQQSRLFVLMMNAGHNNEHYGNIVTYMRMNGIVPPSSRPRSGN